MQFIDYYNSWNSFSVFRLHIDLKPWDSPIRTAEYGKFSLDNENENYIISHGCSDM